MLSKTLNIGESPAFRLAELRSEWTRVRTLLGVFAGLLVLIVLRGVISLAGGHRGEAWPFALLLAGMTAYEVVWLRFVRNSIAYDRGISRATWTASLLIESLLPTIAVLLQTRTSFFGPSRALTSPVVLAYLILISLSTLHLDVMLSRLAGFFSAVEYAAVSLFIFNWYPPPVEAEKLVVYGTSLAYSALLLVAGYAAAAVARQIRLHVIAALQEAENRAKIAQLQHDLGIARSIQQGLLPKSPPVAQPFEVAGWNHPADETGGDYFDWQQLADGRLALTVADVTGHGIGSALVMSACRAYARAGFVTDPDLRELLNHLNRLLYEDLPPEKFVTLAAGLLDPPRSTVHLISAGHGPLLFYSAAANGFMAIDVQGPPLGLLPRFRYGEPLVLTFDHGDILVLVTDGFIEWTNPKDEEFGVDRLQEVIRTHRDKSPAAIIAEVHSAIVKFAGAMPQSDDLTALVVKRV